MTPEIQSAARLLSTPVPNAELVYLVAGHREVDAFANSRAEAVNTISSAMASVGVDVLEFRSILDYGCGCGRILSGWEGVLSPEAKIFGVDINPSLIEFCTANIKFVETSVCGALPPLSFPDTSFDFVYIASVFTHLSLHASVLWAGELARIVQPGGYVLSTFHGDYYANDLAKHSKEGHRALHETGFYYHLHGKKKDTFIGSNSYTTFMTSGFIRSLFKGFEIVRISPGMSYGPTHIAAYQDIVIFKRTKM